VVVIGAGIIGLSCAFALLEDGHEVGVVDVGLAGSGASAGNAGWVTPSLATPLAVPGMLATGLRSALNPSGALVIRPHPDLATIRWLWHFARSSRPRPFRDGVAALLGLTRRTLDELDRMRDRGVAFEEHRAGLLVVARTADGLEWLDTVFSLLQGLGFEGGLEHMDGDAARELEPALGSVVSRATHATIDRHVSPESLVDGLSAYVETHGVLHERRRATGIARDAGRWSVATEMGPLEAEAVVVASALGSAELVRPFGLRLPLLGAKGYSITITDPQLRPRYPIYLCERKLGVTPLAAGVRIAGFFEIGARDRRPSERRIRQLGEETARFMPSLGGSTFAEGPGGWAGFRPATPDGLPLIGPVPGAPGVVLATGHGMLGVTLAPATGLAVTHLVRGERPDWLAPFDPARMS
jgi:D-amino-acid dehydrogenase